MKASYNVTGQARKELVKAISALTGDKAVYKFMPTCAYEIGDITVDKEGGVTCEDADKLERLIQSLIADGFTAETAEETESADKEPAAEETDEACGLTVSLPPDKVSVGNLTNLLAAKGGLIRKALGIADLPIEVTEDAVSFPWFPELPEPEAVKAYTHFIAAPRQDEQRPEARQRHREARRQREVRVPLLPPAPRLHRERVQGGAQDPAQEPLRQLQLEERRTRKGGGGMRMISQGELEALRTRYPAGTRVELIQMDDAQAPPLGTKGTVTGVDDTGSLLVDWDNGSGLSVIYGIDLVRKAVD